METNSARSLITWEFLTWLGLGFPKAQENVLNMPKPHTAYGSCVCVCVCVSHSVVSDSLQPYGR